MLVSAEGRSAGRSVRVSASPDPPRFVAPQGGRLDWFYIFTLPTPNSPFFKFVSLNWQIKGFY